ncbi:MAG: hypothetical protein HYR84_01025 [Planctomycetes bacterium]|nr:hypothetical protein [Planctomycetota bacterium]
MVYLHCSNVCRLAVPIDPSESRPKSVERREERDIFHQLGALAKPLHPFFRDCHDEDESVNALESFPFRLHLLRVHLSAVVDLNPESRFFSNHQAIGLGSTRFHSAFQSRIHQDRELRHADFVFDLMLLAPPAIDQGRPPRVLELKDSDQSDSLPAELPFDPTARFFLFDVQRSAGEESRDLLSCCGESLEEIENSGVSGTPYSWRA